MLTKPTKILLHTCCAPCSGGIIQRLIDSGIQLTVFFYNPNIDTQDEYDKRKKEVTRFCEKKNVPYVDGDYEPAVWNKKIKGLEQEPEKGKRCEECFVLRLERSARMAENNGFDVFATSLSISRYKDLEQINSVGRAEAAKYGLTFWDVNWRKNGGQELGRQITLQENFYRQKYCGCRYSHKAVTQ